MPTPTFQDALTPRTLAAERTLLLSLLVAYDSNVSGWSPGAPQRAFLEGEAIAISTETDIRAALAATADVNLCIAAGESWVDAVMTRFELPNGSGGIGRIPASYAVWDIPLKITAALGTLTINAATAIQLQATNGTIFSATQASTVVINAASSFKGVVRFTARTAGTVAGNVSPGAIQKVILGTAGLSVDLAETQVQTGVARDKETDKAYVRRGLARWGREGAGWTTPAWDYYIPLYGNNGDDLNVTRWAVDETNPDGPGTVHTYLANSTGPATAPEVAAVDAGLNGRDVKPVGAVDNNVSAAVNHALTINITITTDGSNASVEADCESAIAVLIAAFPLGPATLEVDLVSAVARGAPLQVATIATGASSEVIDLDLPGFGSVIEATTVNVFGGVDLATGEVFTATITVTVLP